jgi:hypothetical protein
LIPGFQIAYEEFDLIAKKLGDTIARAIVMCSLSTANPDIAFWDIIWGMCELKSGVPTNNIVWALSSKKTSFLANLSPGEAYDYFSHYLDSLDKDDLRYERKLLRRNRISALVNWGKPIREDDAFYKFFHSTPQEMLLFSYYNIKGQIAFDLEDFSEVEYGQFYIFLESILQQLVTGKGLACPFWKGPDTECCSSACRELLEQVWENTMHDCSWPLWMRLGCLVQEGGTH